MSGLPTTLQLALPDWLHEVVATDRRCPDDESRVAFAIELARRNVENATGGPFGAAVFDGDGRLIAAGVNQVVAQNCSIAHAEMLAFALAQRRLGRFRLNANGERFVLATSAQPCCQCFGATVWAGIDELLIGARSADVEELTDFDEGPLPADWTGELERRGIRVRRDLLRDEARAVLVRYGARGGAAY